MLGAGDSEEREERRGNLREREERGKNSKIVTQSWKIDLYPAVSQAEALVFAQTPYPRHERWEGRGEGGGLK